MATIHNEITIMAPIEKIWVALSNIDQLDRYDPTVKKVNLLTEQKSGVGSKRRVDMRDGKNWFEEKCTVFDRNKALTFELSACSFPVRHLSHTYSFEENGKSVKVKQVMSYQVKFGLLGKLLDMLMIRRQSDKGIKQFFSGLKTFVEHPETHH